MRRVEINGCDLGNTALEAAHGTDYLYIHGNALSLLLASNHAKSNRKRSRTDRLRAPGTSLSSVFGWASVVFARNVLCWPCECTKMAQRDPLLKHFFQRLPGRVPSFHENFHP